MGAGNIIRVLAASGGLLITLQAGCVTPISISEDSFTIGLHRVERQQLAVGEGAETRITGLGIAAIDGRLSIGWADVYAAKIVPEPDVIYHFDADTRRVERAMPTEFDP